MKIAMLSEKQILDNISKQQNPFFDEYYAFYSSWYGGITTNPRMMLLPIDDHMVHRGDGVFEAVKTSNRSVYLLDEHLHRLLQSANIISLNTLLCLDDMKHIVLETLQVANHDDVIIRIYLSRGPGDFSVNPYDSLGAQFYVVITKLHPPSNKKIQEGIAIGQSAIPIKSSWMAQVKSCNYLPNVMMKKEAVDRNLDFVIGIDSHGFIAEGPTENIMMVDKQGTILHPEFDNILKGITMTRVCELARENGLKTKVQAISVKDLRSAQEVMMTGTTLDVLPVVRFENQLIGKGQPGTITKKLRELIISDMNYGQRRSAF